MTDNKPEYSDDAIFSILEYQARTKLKDLYANSKLSTEELSKRSGLDVETLKGIEDGSTEITAEILGKMLDAYHYFKESTKNS